MSLLVLNPDAQAAQALSHQLKSLGFHPLIVSDSEDAVQLCSQGGVQALLVADANILPAVDDLPVGVALVLATSTALQLDAVVSSVDSGVHACWQLPLSDAELRERLHTVCARMERWIAEANSELHAMRTELERDQRAGQYIQLGMLPPNPMGIGHYRLQHRVEPSLILSGDFVDYFQISDRHFACYVADVAGHGASSAFVTVLLKNFSRRLRREYRPSMLTHPGEVLAWINNELIDQQIDKHVAMFFGVVDTTENCLHYANAAHFPPAMLIGGEGIVTLEQKGKPLGIFENAQFESRSIDFPQGSRVVVLSDGVLDLVNAESLEDKEQELLQTVQTCKNMDSLWAGFDLSKLGQDDVSCLMISHEW